MARPIENYKHDLRRLLELGEALYDRLAFDAYILRRAKFKKIKPGRYEIMQGLVPGRFRDGYQLWYSEAQILIKQLLPARSSDFDRCYKGEPNRKEIGPATYGIRDYLYNIPIREYGIYELTTGRHKTAAIRLMGQQVLIVKSATRKFDSQIFDIRALLHADLLSDQLDAARELARNGYLRPAGSLAGLSLEAHLKGVAEKRQLKLPKRPGISDLNIALQSAGLVESSLFSKVRHLCELRNKCVHDKGGNPTKSDLEELISGVANIIKRVSA